MYQWGIHLILLSVIGFFYYRNTRNAALAGVFLPALVLKLLSGICLGLVFLKIYNGTGDTFSFFEYAVKYSKLITTEPGAFIKFFFGNITSDTFLNSQPRVLAFVKFASLITFISFNNYWIATVYFSLISFCGFFYFANKVASAMPESKWHMAIAFLFFPSVVFWSSGFIKESIVMSAMLIITGNFFSWLYEKKSIKLLPVIITVLMCGLVFFIKFYYAAVLIPVLIALVITQYLSRRAGLKSSMQVTIFFTLLFSLFIAVSFMNPYLSINTFLQSVYQNNVATVLLSSDEKLIHFYKFTPAITSFLINLPIALFAGLFRPLIFEAKNVFMIITGIENTCLIILSFFVFFNQKKSKGNTDILLVTSGVFYIVLLASLLAFSSPNLGTLARYKIGFLPFFVYLLLWYSPFEKIINRFKKPL
ncbi:hypothetical protein [Sporocytophaga myxococcoides]|uniref:hypothetical protein n=1 Tax=Sporocytophaga myxococcoides TaxID=153721 RepID=UPI0004083387|nr:hypothetical protein [Sporocytophaga myxococcoides]